MASLDIHTSYSLNMSFHLFAQLLTWEIRYMRCLLQAQPVYNGISDPLIPDEKARAAKLAIQGNGAASRADVQQAAASNGSSETLPATLESCLEDNCVVLSIDTPMQEALQVRIKQLQGLS